MSERGKTFSIKKGLCEAAMCGWTGGVHLHTSGGGENIYHSHRSELDQLIDHDPAGYAQLILHWDVEEYLKKATDYRCLK